MNTDPLRTLNQGLNALELAENLSALRGRGGEGKVVEKRRVEWEAVLQLLRKKLKKKSK